MASFEEDLTELEAIVEKLERGQLPLEENVGLFERGMLLSRACRKVLAEADHRIQVVMEPDERGGGRMEEFVVDEDEDEEIDEEQDEE